ncbi:MAG: hypothetical protein R3284_10005 [Rubricoccaceae bacterium]|nr:hypothetical protein [Rubricoccaceae bacterium]
MLAVYLLLIAAAVGWIASRGNLRLALLYVPVALVGALLGAFVAFDDAPFLLRYPVFNSFTLALLGSVALVCGVQLWQRNRTTSR